MLRIKRKWRKVLLPLACFCFLLFLIYYRASPQPQPILGDDKDKDDGAIKIVTIACTRNNPNNSIVTEASTLIKSILLSALLWQVPELDLFIFVDGPHLKQIILKKVESFEEDLEYKVAIKLSFLNAHNGVPSEIRRRLGSKACNYARLFFPESMPKEIRRVLYLDTDTIVTGNIQRIWETFANETEKMAGMVANDEEEDEQSFLDDFAMIPVLPQGLNAGLIFMNLDLMRREYWTWHVVNVYRKYNQAGSHLEDEQIVNVIFNKSRDSLKLLPCHFNFQPLHCEQGWRCGGALEDPHGVQVMHRRTFQGSSHSRLYEAYTDFDLSNHEKVKQLLLKPLKQYYSNRAWNKSSCHGLLGPHLFKSIK